MPTAPTTAPTRAEPTAHRKPAVDTEIAIQVDADTEHARRVTLTPVHLARRPLLPPRRVPVIGFEARRRARGVWVATAPMVVSRCWLRPDDGESRLATLRRPVRIERPPVRLTFRVWLSASRSTAPAA